ncbi:pirin family protein [Leptospira ognonensis]|uniref:Pirin family protein n=1 Tax=Leptospira ognonensis TaxID=2484945 RepID=A0A4R9JUL5_9LEPT|nr:pirin family protein [Leptospira ognonensis]TGL56509.1 pirin family protein [Leptospira ognonensis]
MNVILKGQKKDLGDQFIIKRILPAMEKRSIGPFVFFDHFGPTRLQSGSEMVVRAHPHIGLATITFLYDGLIHHRDSLGVSQLIRPYETNWMVAGKGIAHSERSEKDPKTDQLEGIQTWIALPAEKEDMDPSFQHLSQNEIPVWETSELTLRLLGGKFLHLSSPAIVHSPLFYADISSDNSSGLVSWKLPEKQEAGLYVSRGSMFVDGKTLHIGEMAVFEKGSEISFSTSSKTRLMLLGGESFPEKRHLWWNFVSTDLAKIEKAKLAWGDETFPKVPGETDRIPLPSY